MKVLIFFFCLFLSLRLFSQEISELQELSLSEISQGLSKNEVDKLSKVFSENKVINLEASKLTELNKWLFEINNRLSSSIEKQGERFPFYKIYMISSSNPESYIFNYQPPGLKFYRGHVFISTGLVENMARNLGGSIEQLTDLQFKELTDGLTGVLAREFSNPKQDELVKWDIRNAQNRSYQSSGQIDELSTDLITIKTLQGADLPPENLLKGLDLLDVSKEQNKKLVKALLSGIKKDPNIEMRINVTRGTLTYLRMEEGKLPEDRVSYNIGSMKSDLNKLMLGKKVEVLLEQEMDIRGGSKVEALIRILRKDSADMTDDFGHVIPDRLNTYLNHLDYFSEIPHQSFTDGDIKSFIKYIEDLDKTMFKNFMGETWFEYHGGSGSGKSKIVEYSHARAFQRTLSKIKAFDHPDFKKWFSSYKENKIESIIRTNTRATADRLQVIFPQKMIDGVYDEFLNLRNIRMNDASRMETYLHMWYGVVTGGGNIDIESKIINKITDSFLESKDSRYVFAQNIKNIQEMTRKPVVLNERFVRYGMEETKKLQKSYARLAREILKEPEVMDVGDQYIRGLNNSIMRVLAWDVKPENFLLQLPAYSFRYTDELLDVAYDSLKSKAWQEEIKSTLRNIKIDPISVNSENNLIRFLSFYSYDKNISSKGYNDFIENFLVENGVTFTKENTKFLADFSGLISNSRVNNTFNSLNLSDFIISKLAKEMTVDNALITLFTEKISPQESLNLFERLKKKSLLDEKLYGELIAKHSYYGTDRYNPKLMIKDKRVNYQIWKQSRNEFSTRRQYLEKLLESFDLSQFDETQLNGAFSWRDNKEGIRAVKQTRMKYHPDYARVLSDVKEGLVEDFKETIHTKARIKTEEFNTAFKKNFDVASDYIKLIFNPDGINLPGAYRQVLNYNDLDAVAEIFVDLLPEDLTYQQKFELWSNLSAKRSNKFTEKYFSTYIKDEFLKGASAEDIENILLDGKVKSDRVRIELAESIMGDSIERLKNQTLNNNDLNNMIQKLISYAPDTSRFRDVFLEKIAWKLQLNERQLNIFIEPLKSFNYKAVNQGFVNMLSTTTTLVEQLNNAEKLSFIKYVQNPIGSIYEALPSLENSISDIVKGTYLSESVFKSQIDLLEVFIRDSSENEKLFIIESFVGTRQKGLFFQGESIKEELFKLANIKGEKLKLFETYLKALPNHEHSVVLSYLLSSAAEETGSDLLKIMEMFQTPGVKFAQMSSIFGIFGEEESKKLSNAKAAAKPPTRAQIFELLNERLPSNEFSKIQSVDRLLGSGSIKYVVQVTFENGEKAAVYLRRPFIEETISNTLDIAEKWMLEIKKDPEFATKMDYDYYLKSLREQLEQEVQFAKEVEFTSRMSERYGKVASYDGWKFKGVNNIPDKYSTKDLYFYELVEDAIPFDSLNEIDKRIASEYILKTELKFIFSEGDADRHLGNYLFDPKKKIIYPLDMGQYYKLTSSSLTKSGQRYFVAKMLYAFSLEDKNVASKQLYEVFDNLKTSSPISEITKKRLLSEFELILKSDKKMMDQVLKILAELNQSKVRLPFSVSLGFIKGLSYVLNEDYAKVLGEEYVQRELKKVVRNEIVKGTPGAFFNKLSKRIKFSNVCDLIYQE